MHLYMMVVEYKVNADGPVHKANYATPAEDVIDATIKAKDAHSNHIDPIVTYIYREGMPE